MPVSVEQRLQVTARRFLDDPPCFDFHKKHHNSMMWMSWTDTAEDKDKEKKKDKEQYVVPTKENHG
jgi:hypothetical protein